MTKKIIAIWAQTEDGLIGKDKVMPWHLPAELQHFKATTTGHAILMGRVTFDGLQRRVLPNRISLILSKDKNYQVDNENVLLFSNVEDVLEWYHKQDRNLYIIGGAQIIRAFEPYLEELIQTQIAAKLEGDTYFPETFDWAPYQEVSSEFHAKDENNPCDFTIKRYQRKDS